MTLLQVTRYVSVYPFPYLCVMTLKRVVYLSRITIHEILSLSQVYPDYLVCLHLLQ